MAVSIEQACLNALATYLASQLSDVEISGEWPDPHVKLPDKAITIIKIGTREDQKIDPQLESSAPIIDPDTLVEDPVLRAYTWRVKLIEQMFQLDVWATYEAVRDDIEARLDEALNQGPLATLSTATISSDDFRDGLLLALSDGHGGIADFIFDGPEISDTPANVQRNEFRSTRIGRVSTALTITKTQPKFAQIDLVVSTPDGESDTYSL